MKFDAFLELARRLQATGDSAPVGSEVRDFALAAINLLGESKPCGFEPPDTFRFSDGRPGVGFGEDTMLSSEARMLAAMLLRAADESEAQQ